MTLYLGEYIQASTVKVKSTLTQHRFDVLNGDSTTGCVTYIDKNNILGFHPHGICIIG